MGTFVIKIMKINACLFTTPDFVFQVQVNVATLIVIAPTKSKKNR